MAQVFDCFMLFNEVELAAMRIEYLWNDVDYFIITQSPETFSGKRKDFAISNPLPQALRPFVKKIILNFAYAWAGEAYTFAGASNEGVDRFNREAHQRNQMCAPLVNIAGTGDVVLMSDADEIPDLCNILDVDLRGVATASHHLKFYRYYLNTWTGDDYPCTIQTRWPLVMTPQDYRNQRFQWPAAYGGWHFSSLYDQKTKLQAFSHAEYDTPYWHERAEENKKALRDPFDRSDKPFVIEDPRGYFPDQVRNDPDRWGEWIYKP